MPENFLWTLAKGSITYKVKGIDDVHCVYRCVLHHGDFVHLSLQNLLTARSFGGCSW